MGGNAVSPSVSDERVQKAQCLFSQRFTFSLHLLLFSLLPCSWQKLSSVLAEFDTYVSPGSLILQHLNIRIRSSHNTRNDFSVKTGKTEVTFKGLISSPSSLEQGTRFREDPICFLLEVVCISVCVQTKVLLSLQFLRWSQPLSAFLN